MRTVILLFCLPVLLFAQESELEKLAERQAAFGRTIPQEKVFIHLDNTSYQLGDTIWFSAYTRRTDTGKPSDVSGVLYVELYGQEGYMIERKLIQMNEGHGFGFFALTKQIQYAGFYELRAYTRWQLNWGLLEREHTRGAAGYFYSKKHGKDYFRDYGKLYSRVFPVYDKPDVPGDFNHDMTLRAVRRLYQTDPKKRGLKLSLYPEGGNLVEGLPCRVAFEAAWEDGEWAEGCLVYNGDSVKTLNRGRGLFEVVPSKGMEQDVVFVSKNGKTAKAKLPKAEQTGVSLRVELTDSDWVAQIKHTADLPDDSLGISLMHEGREVKSEELRVKNNSNKSEGKSTSDSSLFILHSSLNCSGVYQLTIYDSRGRVFADRLFFNRGKEDLQPTLSIEGLKDEYQPYEPVNIKVIASPLLHPALSGGVNSADVSPSPLERAGERLFLSLTVRDDNKRDCLFDDSNILTEMLLSSEIRGFVPQPGWYFEADDSLHCAALDLLMMTQGWRRFDWRSMAVQGAWDITQPAEKAPILLGRTFFTNTPDSLSEVDAASYKRAIDKRAKRQKELKVHAELVAVDAEVAFKGESVTERGAFRIQLPPFYGPSVLFISVADTTKWKKKRPYTWIQAESDNLETDYMYLPRSAKLRRKIWVEPAEYLARISWPYPLFVNPYNYYQEHLASPVPSQRGGDGEVAGRFTPPWEGKGEATFMREVTINAKRNGLRRFDDTWPIFAMDALEASNMSVDYGLPFERIMVGVDFGVGTLDGTVDIGQEGTFSHRYGYGYTRRMLMDKEIPPDSIYARKYLISGTFEALPPGIGPRGIDKRLGSDYKFELSPGESMEYMGSGVWDKYVFYSDYSPRMYGNKQYYGSNEPKTTLVRYPYPDGTRRITYRDRRYILEGFAYPAEFYSPDYSKQIPSEEKRDYRRTLYWNPNLKLDENGEAEVRFYNNSTVTMPSADAQGQTQSGTLLWSK